MAMTNKSQNCTSENATNFSFPKNDNINIYGSFKKIKSITNGVLYRAVEKENTTNVVAVKKILYDHNKENEGFSVDVVQEMLVLKALRHENIISLINVCKDKRNDDLDSYNSTTLRPRSTYLVYEYCEFDLGVLLSNPNVRFGSNEIKSIMKQLLTGLNFIHSKMYIHNDVKPIHILVNKKGAIKICDFQSALTVSLSMTKRQPHCVNQCYRSPESLLGESKFTCKVDMWSVGCIMAELWTKKPILDGTSIQNQLDIISKLCGSINSDVWPNVEKCSYFKYLNLPQNLKKQFKETFPQIAEDENAIALLENLLTPNPSRRIDAETALKHKFFSVFVNPQGLENLLSVLKTE